MAEIIKTFKESVPAMQFIGKKYSDFAVGGEIGFQTVGSINWKMQWEVLTQFLKYGRTAEDMWDWSAAVTVSPLSIGSECLLPPILMFLKVLKALTSLPLDWEHALFTEKKARFMIQAAAAERLKTWVWRFGGMKEEAFGPLKIVCAQGIPLPMKTGIL